MKKVISILLVLILLMGLVACGSEEKATADAPEVSPTEGKTEEAPEAADDVTTEPVTISIWGAWDHNNYRGEWYINKCQEFMELYPNITIEYTGQGGYIPVAEKLNTALMGGGLPTIAQLEESLVYTYQGICADLYDYMDPDVASNYNEGIMKTCIYNDQLLAVPSNRSVVVLYLNTDMLEAAGLDPNGPETWEEFYDYAKTLTESDVCEYGCSWFWDTDCWTWESGMYSFGGQVMSDDGSEITFNTEEGKKIVELIRDLRAAEYCSNCSSSGPDQTYDRATSDFMEGKVAMLVSSSNAWGNLQKVDFDVNITYQPSGSSRSVATGGGNWIVCKDATEEQKQAAALFLEFLATDENVMDWFMVSGYLPSTYTALETDEMKTLLEETPGIDKIMDTVNYTHMRPQSQSWLEVYTYMSPKLEEVIMKPTEVDIDAIMDEAQVQCQAILDSNG